MTVHACVWIDETKAEIIELARRGIGRRQAFEKDYVSANASRRHTHGPAENRLLDAVAHGLEGVDAILILGPGTMRTVLQHHLEQHFPRIAANVWDNRPMGQASEAEIIAVAQDYFRAADRMH